MTKYSTNQWRPKANHSKSVALHMTSNIQQMNQNNLKITKKENAKER